MARNLLLSSHHHFPTSPTSWRWPSPLLTAFLLIISSATADFTGKGCDPFVGTWLVDETYPMYDSSACPFIRPEFDCLRFGRPDSGYLQYRWQPHSCSLPRFDAEELLRRWRGKVVKFVGDSLGLNQYESLLCLLHAADPAAATTPASLADGGISAVKFERYNATVMYYLSHYLVDVSAEPGLGSVLNLGAIDSGARSWLAADVLVFNSWHWWPRRGPTQPWDYIRDGATVVKDMDRTAAFAKALRTWGQWVDANVVSAAGGATVFFIGISPIHFRGEEWGGESNKTCVGETEPVKSATYPAGPVPQVAVVKDALRAMSTPVHLLDITFLSQLRKDAHPSKYNGAHFADDCGHWCVAGLPDTWNQLLFFSLLQQHT